MNKTCIRLLSLLLCCCVLLPCCFICASAETTAADLTAVAQGIIDWKKSTVQTEGDHGYLMNDKFLQQAGTTPGDWYPIGLGRLGIEDNQSGYLAVIQDNVQKRYQTKDKLHAAKATEWHRISLAVLASGGNPRAMGEDLDGDGRGDIDLIADGTYNRVDEKGNGILGKQGINGFIWGLIALDSMYYATPADAYYTRDDIILNILRMQLADGGWALSGETSDPDITAMVLQSFAPYYNSEKEYTYENKRISKGTVRKKVRTAVNEAIEWLSSMQQADGDFVSWGMANCESTVQVIVALCSLGIDVFTDTRFLKQGTDGTVHSLYDGILKYRTASGGFTHSFVNDAENPTAVAGEPNTMASEQTLYGLVSMIRFAENKRSLYDFRPEHTAEQKAQIAAVERAIAQLDATSGTAEIRAAYDAYWAVESSERRYVYSYPKLSELMILANIPFYEEKIDYNSGDAGVVTPTEYFDYSDQAEVKALPKQLTTAYRAQVLRLWQKINNSVDFDGKDKMMITLEKAKNQIDAIQAEIDAIKQEIKEELYPFQSIGLSKKATVYNLFERYLALSEYDRAQFEPSDVEGLMKSKTQVDNLQTALILTACCCVAAAIVTFGIVRSVKKRRALKKANQMPESDE